MAVRVVTDSSADIPKQIIEELGITVVPLYVRFGDQAYRDRVDISEEEFYRKLVQEPIHPTTTQPTPHDFASVYQKLSEEAKGIISIHISGKLSGTLDSARKGRELAEIQTHVEIIDSGLLSMGLGLIVMETARLAKQGIGPVEIMAAINAAIPSIRLLGLLDTLKYVARGGRIGKAKVLLGTVLNVKPLLSLENGEVVPVGQVRSRAKGIEQLFKFVKDAPSVQEVAVAYNTTPDEARNLVEQFKTMIDPSQIHLATIGPVLGAHMGPGAVIVAAR